MFYTLIRSAEFWLAILALIQTLVLSYTGVPEEIWQAINAILLVMIGALTADRVVTQFGRAMKDTIVELRKMEKK